jgi:hypothetical protein
MNSICLLLRKVSLSFEVAERYLTIALRGLSRLYLETIVDKRMMSNNEFTAQKIKQIR